MVRISKWRETPVKQKLVSEERTESKLAELLQPQSGILVVKLTIWVRSFKIKR